MHPSFGMKCKVCGKPDCLNIGGDTPTIVVDNLVKRANDKDWSSRFEEFLLQLDYQDYPEAWG